MRSRLLYAAMATAVTGALAGAGVAVAGATATSPTETRDTVVRADVDVDFAGTMALDNCSGSLVRFTTSQPTASST